MAENLTYQLQFQANQAAILSILTNVKSGVLSIDAAVNGLEDTFKSGFNGMQSAVSNISFSSILDQVDRVTSGLQELAAPGLEFGSTLAEVSAITGVTGAALDDLATKARASAIEFGGNASDSLNTYKVILSRLGPEIATVPAALEAMERQVRTLSKTMGGDAVGAVDAMTTAALQFGVDLSDPTAAAAELDRMMNVMAAGSQKGAAEVNSVADALKVSGVAMKQMNVGFEEGNAAIQALAKGGKEGAEAGTALRNVLGKMAGIDVIPKEAQEKLERLGVNYAIVSDKTRPFAERLRELKKAQGDATIMAQVFGVENAAAATILLDSVDAQEAMTDAITGTNVAYEMAATVMESDMEIAARKKAQIEDLKLSLFNLTGGNLLYVEVLADTGRMLTNLMPLYQGVSTILSVITSKQKMMALWEGITSKAIAVGATIKKAAAFSTGLFSGAMTILNTVMLANPVLAIVAGVAALGAAVYGVTKLIQSNTVAVQANNAVQDRARQASADEIAELNIMIERLKRTKEGTDARREAMQALLEKYPEHLKNHDLEKADLEEISQLHLNIAANIKKRAEEEAYFDLYKESYRELIEMEMNGPSWMDKGLSFIGNHLGNAMTFGGLAAHEKIFGFEVLSADKLHQNKIDNVREYNEELLKGVDRANHKQKEGLMGWIEGIKEWHSNMPGLGKNPIPALGAGASSGIDAPLFFKRDETSMPGTESSSLDPMATKDSKLKKTNSSIATGGSKQVVNTFNFKSMVEHLTVTGKSFKEGVNNMQTEIEEALLRTMAMASAAGG